MCARSRSADACFSPAGFGVGPDATRRWLAQDEDMILAGAVLNRGPLLGAMACLVLFMGWMLYQLSARCPECGNVPACCRCEHEHETRVGR
jgi:hypothetical protein